VISWPISALFKSSVTAVSFRIKCGKNFLASSFRAILRRGRTTMS
jgi:hypothetical protein